jgi:hypothetical protein
LLSFIPHVPVEQLQRFLLEKGVKVGNVGQGLVEFLVFFTAQFHAVAHYLADYAKMAELLAYHFKPGLGVEPEVTSAVAEQGKVADKSLVKQKLQRGADGAFAGLKVLLNLVERLVR